MFNISNYLEKFKRIYESETAKKEAVISVIKEVVGITLKPESVTLKEGVLQIKASPLVRNEINMKKPAILAGFSRKDINIKDIR